MIVSRRCRVLTALLLVTASPFTQAPALAQVPVPDASATPLAPFSYSLPPGTPNPTAEPIPVPQTTPAPIVSATPSVRAAPSDSATPRLAPTPAVPTTRATPATRETATPVTEATPTARQTSVVQPPALTPSVSASPEAPPSAPAASRSSAPSTASVGTGADADGTGWYLPLGVLLALAAGGGLLWWRRRRSADDASLREPQREIVPVPVPVPELVLDAPAPAVQPFAAAAPKMLARRAAIPAASVVPDKRAWIELELRPRRAGLNLLTATADVEVLVRNRGEAEAVDVRIDARLTSARADQDAELGQVFAEAQGRPAVAPFTLAPGAERSVRALVTLPRAAINVLTAAERPMFVPVVTVNARYALGGSGQGQGQTAQAFALGIERVGAAKLAPFWLDAPSRMFEAVAARPHALAIAS